MIDYENPLGQTPPAGFSPYQLPDEPDNIQGYNGPEVNGDGINLSAHWQCVTGVKVLLGNSWLTLDDLDELVDEITTFRDTVRAAQAEHERVNS